VPVVDQETWHADSFGLRGHPHIGSIP
jgi:hypothetical protein